MIVALLLLLAGLQYKLWWGEGSRAEIRQLQQTLAAQRAENDRLRGRNEALAAEVTDLKEGLEALEERARWEMGMIRQEEKFFLLLEAETPQGEMR